MENLEHLGEQTKQLGIPWGWRVGKHLKRMGKVVLAFSGRVHVKREGGSLEDH